MSWQEISLATTPFTLQKWWLGITEISNHKKDISGTQTPNFVTGYEQPVDNRHCYIFLLHKKINSNIMPGHWYVANK